MFERTFSTATKVLGPAAIDEFSRDLFEVIFVAISADALAENHYD
jgi:hypothetical protein